MSCHHHQPSLDIISDHISISNSTSAVENEELPEDEPSFGHGSEIGGVEGLSYEETYEGSRRYYVVGRGRNPGIYTTW